VCTSALPEGGQNSCIFAAPSLVVRLDLPSVMPAPPCSSGLGVRAEHFGVCVSEMALVVNLCLKGQGKACACF
jgi:hypothetical protein